jgi:uncharacterized membrane protein (UPF0127 family)
MREVVAATPRGDVLLCRVAETGRDRRIGLRGARGLSLDATLLFLNATSVHTLGMRFPILVVRLDDTFTVVDVRRVRPGRYVRPMRRASHVLECNEDVDVRVGDVLRIEGSDRSAGDRANEREHHHRGKRQGDDNDRNDMRGPSRESDWLAAGGVGFDEPQELQQRPHWYKASAADLGI